MKTLVIGASPNPERYAYKAVISLLNHGYDVVPLGIKKGNIKGLTILNGFHELKNVDTVTLYINAINQKNWYDYILNLHPRRIIFNPGAENKDLEGIAQKNGIQTIEACTLVMLATGIFGNKPLPTIEQNLL